jgi:hypothetical protein
LVVSLAGVVDLVGAANRCAGFGANPIAELMGGMPDELSDIYDRACPRRLPLNVPALLVQGTAGDDPDLIDLCRSFVDERAGEEFTYLELDNADHFAVVDPDHAAWLTIGAKLGEVVPATAIASGEAS